VPNTLTLFKMFSVVEYRSIALLNMCSW